MVGFEPRMSGIGSARCAQNLWSPSLPSRVVGEDGHVLVGPPELPDDDGVADDHQDARQGEDRDQLEQPWRRSVKFFQLKKDVKTMLPPHLHPAPASANWVSVARYR